MLKPDERRASVCSCEDEEDRQAATEALAEYEREAGVAAEEFLAHTAAEVRSRYGSDAP